MIRKAPACTASATSSGPSSGPTLPAQQPNGSGIALRPSKSGASSPTVSQSSRQRTSLKPTAGANSGSPNSSPSAETQHAPDSGLSAGGLLRSSDGSCSAQTGAGRLPSRAGDEPARGVEGAASFVAAHAVGRPTVNGADQCTGHKAGVTARRDGPNSTHPVTTCDAGNGAESGDRKGEPWSHATGTATPAGARRELGRIGVTAGRDRRLFETHAARAGLSRRSSHAHAGRSERQTGGDGARAQDRGQFTKGGGAGASTPAPISPRPFPAPDLSVSRVPAFGHARAVIAGAAHGVPHGRYRSVYAECAV